MHTPRIFEGEKLRFVGLSPPLEIALFDAFVDEVLDVFPHTERAETQGIVSRIVGNDDTKSLVAVKISQQTRDDFPFVAKGQK